MEWVFSNDLEFPQHEALSNPLKQEIQALRFHTSETNNHISSHLHSITSSPTINLVNDMIVEQHLHTASDLILIFHQTWQPTDQHFLENHPMKTVDVIGNQSSISRVFSISVEINQIQQLATITVSTTFALQIFSASHQIERKYQEWKQNFCSRSFSIHACYIFDWANVLFSADCASKPQEDHHNNLTLLASAPDPENIPSDPVNVTSKPSTISFKDFLRKSTQEGRCQGNDRQQQQQQLISLQIIIPNDSLQESINRGRC